MMSNFNLKACELENKKWKCPICSKVLSRKQTLQDHLWGIHNENVGPSTRYKRYKTDETVHVPRSTLHRWSLQGSSTSTECQTNKSGSQQVENATTCTIGQHVTPIQQEQVISFEDNLEVDDQFPLETENCSDIDPIQLTTENDEFNPLVTEHPAESDVFPSIHILDFIDRFDEEDMEITISEDGDDINPCNATTDANNASDDDDDDDDDDERGQQAADDGRSVEQEGECSSVDPPLYVIPARSLPVSSSITVQEHVCAIGAFAARHNISDVAFKDLLSLVQLHIPKDNIGETRVQSVKAKCGFDKDYLNFHFYCEVCNKLYNGETDFCLTQGCTGNKSTGASARYFVTSNLGTQLQEVLQRGNLWEMTRKHMNVVHTNICDIQGGQLYQELLKPGQFLYNSNNVTFSVFTDGVALFKSSGVQLWPVYLLINEIPPKERFHRKNMLLWGIWQGRGKPRMNMFLRPLVCDLLNLYHKGTEIIIKDEKIHIKAMLVVATMDLPARAYVANMTQYNGKFGCLYCEDEGTIVQSGAGTCRAFLSRAEPAKQRTKESIIDCSLKAYNSGDRNMGVSVLSYLPQFSLNTNITIDYMHGILLGISKKLMDQWFDAKYCGEDFYIGDKVSDVDKQLTKIQPPYIIHRTPRSIKNTLKNWKASEFRNWLLFYAIPCLINILPILYLKHFSLLVEATYMLLSTGITSTDLEKADKLLHAFHENAQLLYGQKFMGLNVHNLIHLVAMVKNWGPLWAWSCFPFESFNGELKKTIHGTGNVCRQIFWSFQAEKRILFETSKTDLRSGSNARMFVEQLFDTQDGLLTSTDAHMCQVVLPKCRKRPRLSEEEERQIKFLLPAYEDNRNVIRLLKVIRNGYVFSTKANAKVSKQNSYTFLLDPRIQQEQDAFALRLNLFFCMNQQ